MKYKQRNLIMAVLGSSQLVGGYALAQTAADVVCTHCVDGSDIANDSVGGSKLRDGSIRTDDLAAGAVKSANIATGAVSIGKLSPQIRDLLDASIVSLSTQTVPGADIGVAAANCPSDRIPISASCFCDGSVPSSNLGVLAICVINGSGAVAACFNEALTFDPQLDDPVAVVKAVCLGASSADGSPWLPAAFKGLTSYAKSSGASDDSAPALLQWNKKQSDDFENAVKNARNRYEVYRQRIRSR